MEFRLFFIERAYFEAATVLTEALRRGMSDELTEAKKGFNRAIDDAIKQLAHTGVVKNKIDLMDLVKTDWAEIVLSRHKGEYGKHIQDDQVNQAKLNQAFIDLWEKFLNPCLYMCGDTGRCEGQQKFPCFDDVAKENGMNVSSYFLTRFKKVAAVSSQKAYRQDFGTEAKIRKTSYLYDPIRRRSGRTTSGTIPQAGILGAKDKDLQISGIRDVSQRKPDDEAWDRAGGATASFRNFVSRYVNSFWNKAETGGAREVSRAKFLWVIKNVVDIMTADMEWGEEDTSIHFLLQKLVDSYDTIPGPFKPSLEEVKSYAKGANVTRLKGAVTELAYLQRKTSDDPLADEKDYVTRRAASANDPSMLSGFTAPGHDSPQDMKNYDFGWMRQHSGVETSEEDDEARVQSVRKFRAGVRSPQASNIAVHKPRGELMHFQTHGGRRRV